MGSSRSRRRSIVMKGRKLSSEPLCCCNLSLKSVQSRLRRFSFGDGDGAGGGRSATTTDQCFRCAARPLNDVEEGKERKVGESEQRRKGDFRTQATLLLTHFVG